MTITKKVRFDVFKRDGFVCQYCGRTPPAVVLEADHIEPKAKGGLDTIDNLITACYDCNRGKSAELLTAIPESIAKKAEVLAEREEQLRAYNRLKKSIRKREDRDIAAVEEVFSGFHEGYSFSSSFRESIRRHFLQVMQVDALCDAMYLACGKIDNRDAAIRYFCGICWRTIRADQTS